METYQKYYCFNTFYMKDGDVAFENGKYYDGYIEDDGWVCFISKIGGKHFLDKESVETHLKVFKFGR